MAFNKIGFHFGSKANATGWGDYVRALDAAGIPAVCMSMAGEGLGDIIGCWDKGSTVQHVAVVRYMPPDGTQDVPPYGTDAQQAAVNWWAWIKPLIGPDVRRYSQRIVIKCGNELDKNQSEWLAEFYLALYDIMQSDPDGPFRLGAFGFAAGEPEPIHWRGPKMLKYLRLCAADPLGAAVVLHEYSYMDTLDRGNPNGRTHIGRVTDLFAACDENEIARPFVCIHEFGWRQDTLPGESTAMAQLPWAAKLYAAYPEVAGAGLWTLQGAGSYGNPHISKLVQPLIVPIREYSLTATFPDPDPIDPPGENDMDCNPRVPYARENYVVPQDATMARYLEVAQQAFAGRKTITFSYDDAGHAPGVSSNTAVLYDIPAEKEQEFIDWYAEHYPETQVIFAGGSPPDKPTANIQLIYRPCDTQFISQIFGANPANYADIPLPGHDGLDYAVVKDAPYYAAASGVVVHASDRRWSSNTASNYGWHVVLQHEGGYATVYAHARPDLPVKVGDEVAAGQIVGYSGNTGFSTGYHLHLGLLDQTGTVDPDNGYPTTWKYGRPVNPWPWVEGKPAPPTDVPAAGPARIGLHASADPGDLYGGEAEYNEFTTLFPGVIKVLSAHSETAVKRLATDNPGAEWIIRAFQTGWDRNITPQQFFDWTSSDTLRTVNALRSLGVGDEHIRIELHNEPNLVQEGWGATWSDGTTFNGWLLDVLAKYRNFLPTVKYLYPGLSPGGAISGVRYDSAAFLDQSIAAAQACDGVGVHTYWSDPFPIQQAYAHIDWYTAKFGTKPLWITEASRNDRPATKTPMQYANEYFAFWQELKKRPSVQGVTFFVASGSDPYFQPECWVVNGKSQGIAAEIKKLKGA